jgi:hypothetical protein
LQQSAVDDFYCKHPGVVWIRNAKAVRGGEGGTAIDTDSKLPKSDQILLSNTVDWANVAAMNG